MIAEVNPDDVDDMPRGIVSSPNCTTTVPLVALAPLHRAAGIRRMVVSSYQSVSGAGSRASTSSTSSGRRAPVSADQYLVSGREPLADLLHGARSGTAPSPAT